MRSFAKFCETYKPYIEVAPAGTTPELVWVDLETTGLEVETDVVLEIGLMLTDRWGRVIKDGVRDWLVTREHPSWARESYVDHAGSWPSAVRTMHEQNGLIDELKAAGLKEEDTQKVGSYTYGSRFRIEEEASSWLRKKIEGIYFNGEPQPALSGSTPHFDRGFLAENFARVHEQFHYRNGIDVSGIRTMIRLVGFGYPEPEQMKLHRAIPDLIDSVALYRHILATHIKTDAEKGQP